MRQAFAAPLLLACAVAANSPAAGRPQVITVSREGGSSVSESTDLYEFEFSYPASAARILKLRAELERERREARAKLIATASSERKSLASAGIEYRPHSLYVAWQTVADLPHWLSLSASFSTYEGGAHPNHGFDALIWDKNANARRAPMDLFFAPAFRTAVKQRLCAALDRERAKKRGGETLGEPGDWMNACIDPVTETTVILGSGNGRAFDRIGFLIAPYAAGPYAEGDYEITLPVDPMLLDAVRPAYRTFFAIGR